MVNPTLSFPEIESSLSRLHTIVFGPGLGRDVSRLTSLLNDVLYLILKTPQLGLVIDAVSFTI